MRHLINGLVEYIIALSNFEIKCNLFIFVSFYEIFLQSILTHSYIYIIFLIQVSNPKYSCILVQITSQMIQLLPTVLFHNLLRNKKPFFFFQQNILKYHEKCNKTLFSIYFNPLLYMEIGHNLHHA